MKFCINIQGLQRKNPTEFGDFSSSTTMKLTAVLQSEISWQVTFLLASQAGQGFKLFNDIYLMD